MQAANPIVSSYMNGPPLTDTSNSACRGRLLRKSKSFQHSSVAELKKETFICQAEGRTSSYDGYQKGHKCQLPPIAPLSEVHYTECT